MKLNFLNNGIIKIEVRVFSKEQFLNVLWKNGVKIHNIKNRDVFTLIIEINYKDYEFVKDIVDKLQGKINIISSRGQIFIVGKMKKKIGIVIGGVLFIGILYSLSTFVWRIEIETKRNLAPYEVRQELKKMGISPGTSKSNINVYDLEKKIENQNSDIMWVNARIEGSVLKIKIEEKINPPMRKKEEKVDNVIANMDGEIKKVYTTSGTAKVKAGDIVKKGDILIVPKEGKEGEEFDVPAKGMVLANTFYEKVVELKVGGQVEERTGNTDMEIYLDIYGKKIYLKKPTKSFESYDKIEENGKYIHESTYYEKVSKDITGNKETIINDTVELLKESTLKGVSKQAKLVDKIITTEDIDNNKIRLKVLFVIEQDIALNY